MDEQLKKLKAPERTATQRSASLQKIKAHTVKNGNRVKWQYYTTLVSAAMLLLVLLASILAPQQSGPATQVSANSSTQIEKIYFLKTFNNEYVPQISKWYYLGKNKASKKELELLVPYLNKLTTAEMNEVRYRNDSYQDFLVQYEDGSKHYVQMHLLDGHDLWDSTTHQKVALTEDEWLALQDIVESQNAWYRSALNLGLIILAYFVYINVIRKVSPMLRLNFESQNRKIKRSQLWRGIGFYLLLILLVGQSGAIYSAVNLLFVASVLALFFSARLLLDYWNGNFKRSFWEIPISTAFYTLFVILYSL